MFKKLLSAIAFGCIALCATAQELEQSFSLVGNDTYSHGIIPQTLTYDSESQFWIGTKSNEEDYPGYWKKISVYNENLEPLVNIESEYGIIPILFKNAIMCGYSVPVSQGIFNGDKKYEYITPTSVDKAGRIHGVAIKQDDETILATLSFGNYSVLHGYLNENSYPFEVLKIGENKFLLVNLWDNESDSEGRCHIIRLYSIDTMGNHTSIKKVRDIPQMKVSPTLPQKNETIKINLADMKSPNKLSVIDTNGKVCFTQTIQANQKDLELSTNGMPTGMYIIRVTDGNKDVDNCRVIIR